MACQAPSWRIAANWDEEPSEGHINNEFMVQLLHLGIKPEAKLCMKVGTKVIGEG